MPDTFRHFEHDENYPEPPILPTRNPDLDKLNRAHDWADRLLDQDTGHIRRGAISTAEIIDGLPDELTDTYELREWIESSRANFTGSYHPGRNAVGKRLVDEVEALFTPLPSEKLQEARRWVSYVTVMDTQSDSLRSDQIDMMVVAEIIRGLSDSIVDTADLRKLVEHARITPAGNYIPGETPTGNRLLNELEVFFLNLRPKQRTQTMFGECEWKEGESLISIDGQGRIHPNITSAPIDHHHARRIGRAFDSISDHAEQIFTGQVFGS